MEFSTNIKRIIRRYLNVIQGYGKIKAKDT